MLSEMILRPRWVKLAMVMVCGYGLFGRTFAYIGIPPAKLFIGDIVLALFLVFCSSAVLLPAFTSLVRPTPLSTVVWTMLLFFSYGFLELLLGLEAGYSPLVAIQNLVFNIYPLFFFFGLASAITYPEILPRIIRFIAWFSCIYGIAYFLVLKRVNIVFPGTDVPVISTPGGASTVLLGLPFLDKDLRRYGFPIVAAVFFVLAGQVRAEWLSLTIALAVQAFLTRKVSRFLWGAAVAAALLFIGFVTDVRIPSPSGRGGAVEAREIIARAAGAIDRDAAAQYSRKNASFYAGTVGFRTKWWSEIWDSVHADNETAVLGHGYGYPLHELAPYLRDSDVRTPHNVFYYALGYSGWLGVLIFFSFQAALGAALFNTWRVSGQSVGFVFWLAALIAGLFGNSYETPFGAIPLYLILGMSSAPLLAAAPSDERLTSAQLVPAARW